eukprot:7788676-Pyramimonas_sp.AAC.1
MSGCRQSFAACAVNIAPGIALGGAIIFTANPQLSIAFFFGKKHKLSCGLVTFLRPRGCVVNDAVGDCIPLALVCLRKPWGGAAHLNHECTRLRHGCLQGVHTSHRARALQQRHPDALLLKVRHHAFAQPVELELHRQLGSLCACQRRAQSELRRVAQVVQDVAEVGPVAVDEVNAVVVGRHLEAAGEQRFEVGGRHRREGLQGGGEAVPPH